MARISFLTLVMFAGAFMLGGCQVGQISQLSPQSNFNYPNSNVKPLGPVKVKIPGRTCWMYPPLPCGDDESKLHNAAIAKVGGATMVVDYVQTVRLYNLYLIPLWWSELELEGTAAKAEVGKQKLGP